MHARYYSGYLEGLELPEKFRQTYYKFQIVRLPKISLGSGLLHGKQSYFRETILDPHTTNLETESTLLMFFKSNINHWNIYLYLYTAIYFILLSSIRIWLLVFSNSGRNNFKIFFHVQFYTTIQRGQTKLFSVLFIYLC